MKGTPTGGGRNKPSNFQSSGVARVVATPENFWSPFEKKYLHAMGLKLTGYVLESPLSFFKCKKFAEVVIFRTFIAKY